MLTELLDEDGHEIPDEIASPLDARSAMIRLRQLERDLEREKTHKKLVAEQYDQRIASIGREITRARDTIRAFVFTHGKISFPDVGTAYKRKVDAKIEVIDKDAFELELGAVFTRPVFDDAAARAFALEQALDQGIIVPGTEFVPAGEDVTVRKA